MTAFLSKPFEPRALYQSLLDALSTREAARGPGATDTALAGPADPSTEPAAARPRAPGMPTEVAGTPAWRPLLERLAALLARGDASARELVLEHGTLLARQGGPDGQRLVDLVLRFDLEPALTVARRMLVTPSTPPPVPPVVASEV